MIRVYLCLISIALVASPLRGHAAPLELRHVPADAQGVGHLDLEALRRTGLYQSLDLEAELAKAFSDVSPLIAQAIPECTGISLWIGRKVDANKHDRLGAVVFEFRSGAKVAKVFDDVVKRLHGTKEGDHYAIKLDHEISQVALVGDSVVFTDLTGDLGHTLAVMRGKAPALTEKAMPGGALDHGVFVFAALGSELLRDVKADAASSLLKADLTTLVFRMSQVGTDLKAQATGVLSSGDDAQNVKTVIDGLIALFALSEDAKPFLPLDQYVKVTVHGTSVDVAMTFPVAVLVKYVMEHK
jgi:hypothetical protein